MGINSGTTALDGLGVRLFGGGGGGGPTSPSDISGLVAWWKTENLVAPTPNQFIASWPDASGNGRTATPAGTGFVYRTSVINSRAVVEINSDDAPFTSANLGTSHTVFIVFRPIAGFNDGVILGGDAIGKYTPYLDTTDVYYRAQSSDGFVSVAHGGLTTNTAYLLEVVRNNTSVSFFKNAAQIGTTQTLGANTSLTIVQLSGLSGGTLPLNAAQIAEVFIYNSALSLTDRQAMETYVNNRFALF